MNPAPEERQLGEYRLKELLAENTVTRRWLAEQISVSRRVLLDELRPDQSHYRDAFLANVRAKAAVDHPLIESVYEAVVGPGSGPYYYTHELLPGISLAQRAKMKQRLLPARLANLLRQVAEAHLQHETLGQATSPLDLGAVHQDEHGVVRLENLAIAGPRSPDQSVRDIVHLGSVLVPLITTDQPGTTRMLTLCAWMRGEGLETPLTWDQVRDFCMQIEHQLANPASSPAATRAEFSARKKTTVALIALATVVVAVGVAVLASRMRSPALPASPRANLPEAVTVAPGDSPTPDGSVENHGAFRISANEITIGQYAEFLEILGTLAKDRRERTFDSPGQAPGKTSHEPADWPAQFAAAKANGIWQNQPITLDCPVTGVDWWDAAAYAEWKKARLPTQEEWFAALHLEVKNPAELLPGPWAPVTSQTLDRTPAGLLGMAGSVCEWTAKPAPNPSNPLGEKLWVVIGGSYLKLGSNALTREWTADRSLRRPDLGFRVVFDAD
jgi:formylglycine-generating enzyme required for sulfatase activity